MKPLKLSNLGLVLPVFLGLKVRRVIVERRAIRVTLEVRVGLEERREIRERLDPQDQGVIQVQEDEQDLQGKKEIKETKEHPENVVRLVDRDTEVLEVKKEQKVILANEVREAYPARLAILDSHPQPYWEFWKDWRG